MKNTFIGDIFMKNKKRLIIILSILLVVIVAVVVCVIVFSGGKAQRKTVYENFKITIPKDAEKLYFEIDAKENSYCYAAYKITEEQYGQIFGEMQSAGYTEREIRTAKGKEWIPMDELLKAYRSVEGNMLQDFECVCKYVYVTDSIDGYRSIYLVRQIESFQ